MMLKNETISPKVQHILTGHFYEGRGYRNWRTQGTDSWLVILTLNGHGYVRQNGHEQTTQSGDISLMRPGTYHDYGTDTDEGTWELLWAHFHPRPHWHELLAWPESAPGLMFLHLAEPIIHRKIRDRFLEAHRLATGAMKSREVFALNALEEVLLWCGTQNPLAQRERLDHRVQLCLDFVCRDLTIAWTLSDLAAHVNLSVSRLAHLFQEQVGMTPQQFQEQQRMSQARQLLELSGRSIGDIAADVGYENPFYFSLRFKKLMGISPRDYRKKISRG
jgi:AraC family transcriptional regulator of arabinose operon